MERKGLIFIGDFVSFWISFFIILLIRFGWPIHEEVLRSHILPFTILFISWVLIFFIFGLYNIFSIKTNVLNIKRYILAILVSFIFGIILFYFTPIFEISPKTNLLLQIGLYTLASLSLRRIIYNIFSKTITRPLVIVGQNEYLEKLHSIIKGNPQMGLNILSYSHDEKDIISKYINTKNLLFIFENIPEIKEADMAILFENNSEVIDTAKAYERYLEMIPVDYIDQKWVLDNLYSKEYIAYDMIRKIMDIGISLTVIIILSPLLVIAMLAKLIEDGRPIFIKQKRVGENGKVFNLYKMRSMIVLSPDGSAETANNIVWAENKDPRITKIGRILRKSHIDEIPQMINILNGDITLIGPRPERPEFVSQLEESIPHYKLRHIIKPGFTGWAQIKYRYARTVDDSKEKFEYDLYYIKNKNLFLDIGILLKTIQIIFTH